MYIITNIVRYLKKSVLYSGNIFDLEIVLNNQGAELFTYSGRKKIMYRHQPIIFSMPH
jgi:hypothetical protein